MYKVFKEIFFPPQAKTYIFKDAHKTPLATSQKASHLLNRTAWKDNRDSFHTFSQDSAIVWTEVHLLQLLNSFHNQHEIICKLNSDVRSDNN